MVSFASDQDDAPTRVGRTPQDRLLDAILLLEEIRMWIELHGVEHSGWTDLDLIDLIARASCEVRASQGLGPMPPGALAHTLIGMLAARSE